MCSREQLIHGACGHGASVRETVALLTAQAADSSCLSLVLDSLGHQDKPKFPAIAAPTAPGLPSMPVIVIVLLVLLGLTVPLLMVSRPRMARLRPL